MPKHNEKIIKKITSKVYMFPVFSFDVMIVFLFLSFLDLYSANELLAELYSNSE